MAPEKYLAQYQHLRNTQSNTWKEYGEQEKNANQIYAAMVTNMDDGIGRILKSIRRSGIEDNTLVIFFSDNGATGVGSSNAPLREGKSTVFEGGIRTPAALRWPAKIKGGRKVDARIAYIDVFPTLMKILGIRDHGGKPFDGIDVWDIWKGEKPAVDREIFSYLANEGDEHEMIALSDSKWKLICLGPNIIDEKYDDSLRKRMLFRIDQDTYEEHDVWQDNPEIGEKMYKRLQEYRALQIKDRVLPYRIGRLNFKPPKGWPPKEWNMKLYPR